MLRRRVESGCKVLDFGCGTGAGLAELGQDYRVVGLDRSELALEFCRSRGLEEIILGDGASPPFRANFFDGIVALDIFEHIERDDIAFREALRILKPGGTLVLSVPAHRWLWGPHDVALMHYRRYRAAEVAAKLAAAGFQVERVTYSVFLLFPAVVLLRLFDRFRRGPTRVSLPDVGPILNRLLLKIMALENRWLTKRSLPWGSSVIAVARKGD